MRSIVTLSITNNVKLVKLLEDRFNRPVYWNKYQIKTMDQRSRQQQFYNFALAFNNTEGNAKVGRNNDQKYFLPRVNITTTC